VAKKAIAGAALMAGDCCRVIVVEISPQPLKLISIKSVPAGL